ncbi:MAG: flagellar hook-basal body complex protein [Arcobacteraceae bacterium]
MNGSIYTGASGLLSFQKGIDITSNNVANVNTVGFKSDRVSFNDLMYQDGIGKGVTTNEVLKNFSQGSLIPSDSEYDFALAGEGFFTLQDPVSPDRLYYTRTGQFSTDSNNYLSSSTGLLVMGVAPTVTGDMITSEYDNAITSTVIDTDDTLYTLNTYTNDYKTAAREISLVMQNIDMIEAYNAGTATPEEIAAIDGNPALIADYTKYTAEVTALKNTTSGAATKSVDTILDDISDITSSYENALKAFSINPIDGVVASKAQSTVAFPLDVNTEGEYTLEILINGVKVQQKFDTDVPTTLNAFSDQINQFSGITSSVDTTDGTLSVESLISGNTMVVASAKLNDASVDLEETQAAAGSGQALIDALYVDLQSSLAKVGGKAVTNKSEIVDVQTGTAPVTSPLLLDLNSLGMSSALYEKLVSGSTDAIASYPSVESEDGNIYLRDGDARFLVGKILPVTFTNISGLNPQGDNLYMQSVDQNAPMYISEGTTVMGKYLEQSNADLSESLVELMVWQKAFDANSKTVMTSDELLKTALALKTT